MNFQKTLVTITTTVILVSCADEKQLASSEKKDNEEKIIGSIVKSQEKTISEGDRYAIQLFMQLPSRWNHAAAPLIRDYMDPNVPTDRWVKEASIHIGELRAVRIEMATIVVGMQDPGIKSSFDEMANNYRDKLDCLVALQNAVARGDRKAEESAMTSLSEAATQGQQLAKTWLDRLRPHVDQQKLIETLNIQGKKTAELLRPE